MSMAALLLPCRPLLGGCRDRVGKEQFVMQGTGSSRSVMGGLCITIPILILIPIPSHPHLILIPPLSVFPYPTFPFPTSIPIPSPSPPHPHLHHVPAFCHVAATIEQWQTGAGAGAGVGSGHRHQKTPWSPGRRKISWERREKEKKRELAGRKKFNQLCKGHNLQNPSHILLGWDLRISL